MKTQVIWIDFKIDNQENKNYVNELNKMDMIKLGLFKDVDKAIKYMKMIEFKETKIIVSGILYSKFIQKFKENITDMCIAPKIIVFTKDKKDFIKKNKDYNNNIFYSYGGIAVSFEEIKNFLKKDKKIKTQLDDDIQLTFEYIDTINKLALPMFFKTLIDNQNINNIEKYTNKLYDKYSKEKFELKELLGSIKSINDIPIEILCKYYIKLYTADSSFHKNMNKDLGLNKKEEYLSYIKILYEGVKLKSLPLTNSNILYRGTKISNKEINDIKNFIKEKKEGLPSSIVFSKSFFSFTKDKKIAENFLNNTTNTNNTGLSNVLFILEKDDNIKYNLSTHGDIEKISFFPHEREVLFFPFSSFEIKDLQYINNRYEIKLLYLGKYLKDIKNNINEDELPKSEFKKQLTEFGLIPENQINNVNTKTLYNQFKKQYAPDLDIQEKNNNEKKININKETNTNTLNNYIIGEINISSDDINKDTQIINSNKDDDNNNSKEIEENTQIKINGKNIGFSYTYKFTKEGKYKIEYIFKKNFTNLSYMFSLCNSLTNLNLSNFNTENITNLSSMFSDCNALINLNLSNFNTKNVTNMNNMFSYCNSLTNLNLIHFNTQNVINMGSMFYDCKSLTNLNLSNFNTKNVTNMSFMFNDCKSLTNLDLSNFNTQNATDMSGMFNGCNSLTNLNLSNFNTQNVTDMGYMFYGCKSLTYLNLYNFNAQKDTNTSEMFKGCPYLEKKDIITKDATILKEIDKKINKI